MSQLTGLPFDTMPSTQTVVPTTNEHPAQRHTAGQLPGQTLPQLCMQRLGRARPGILHFLNPNTSCKPLQAGGIVTSKRPSPPLNTCSEAPKSLNKDSHITAGSASSGRRRSMYTYIPHIYTYIYIRRRSMYTNIYIYICKPIRASQYLTPGRTLQKCYS